MLSIWTQWRLPSYFNYFSDGYQKISPSTSTPGLPTPVKLKWNLKPRTVEAIQVAIQSIDRYKCQFLSWKSCLNSVPWACLGHRHYRPRGEGVVIGGKDLALFMLLNMPHTSPNTDAGKHWLWTEIILRETASVTVIGLEIYHVNDCPPKSHTLFVNLGWKTLPYWAAEVAIAPPPHRPHPSQVQGATFVTTLTNGAGLLARACERSMNYSIYRRFWWHCFFQKKDLPFSSNFEVFWSCALIWWYQN